MKKQQVVPAGTGIEYKWESDHIFVKTVGAVTDGRMSLVEDTLQPGFQLPRHYHKKMAEIFYILEGELTFVFDDETVIATAGTTVNIPVNVWHAAHSERGAKMLTIFSIAGFEDYLAEMNTLTEDQFADEAFMTALAERYDVWDR